MFQAENVTTLMNGLAPYPNMDDIFLPNQSWLKTHFMPLASIELGIINPEWAGQTVYMLLPFEPVEGYIGYETTEYHNEFTAPNWFTFRLTDDNHYEFLGKEGYFLRNEIHNWDFASEDEAELQEMQHGFDTYKANYEKTGKLINHWFSDNDGTLKENRFFEKLGGEFDGGNWSNYSDDQSPPAFKMTVERGENLPNDGISITYQGKPFFHIATVYSGDWTGEGDVAVIMMFEPVSKLVLFTFDFT